MREPNTEQVSEIGLYIALPILALLAIACAVLTYVVIKLCRQKTEKALMDDSRSATLTDDSGEETHFLKNMPEGAMPSELAGMTMIVVCLMVGVRCSENKKFDCLIGLDERTVIYWTAGEPLVCQIEKLKSDVYTVNIDRNGTDWLEYKSTDQLIVGAPEKEDVGSSSIFITVRSNHCTSTVPWRVAVTFVIEFPQQISTADSCDSPPEVFNPVNHIQTTVGDVFKLDLNPLTFVDKEDGNARHLQITLKALFNFDLEDNFCLVAMDTCQQSVVDSIRLEVKENSQTYSHEFTIYFGDDHDDSPSSFDVYKFITGLSQWLEFTDSTQIYVSNVDPELRIISWIDKSLSTDFCERSQILDTYYKMADVNGTILDEFSCYLSPFFNVTGVFVDFKDVCNMTDLLWTSTNSNTESYNDEMYLFYILIPVAVLTIVILVIIIIMLVRKCTKRNKYVMHSEKPVYLTDRQPVIFQNEYNEEETSLRPQIPIIIDNFDTGLLSSSGRSVVSPPSYIPPEHSDPPQYRLPPPYSMSSI
ncbi:Hypothetical predicted protein [Mytilus galloprovincialis]|nr:Hypothetical predicted protein [Mytilus galloprovincialis]